MTGIIQFPIDWYRFSSGSFFLSTLNFKSVSPWTGRQSISGPNSQMWQVDVTFSMQDRELWSPFEALIAQLAGQANVLRFGDFGKRRPGRDLEAALDYEPWSDSTFFSDGTGFSSGFLPPYIYAVEAAEQRSKSIVVGGLPVSESRVLRRGDNFEHRPGGIYDCTPRMHMITKDAHTNSDGETRIEFLPPLRGGVSGGDQIVISDPMSVFRLADDSQGAVTRTSPTFGDLGFKLIEAIV